LITLPAQGEGDCTTYSCRSAGNQCCAFIHKVIQ
jgi:hypothetical protein